MQKVCVIGCGRGITHGLAYRDIAKVVGVCDTNPDHLSDALSKIQPTPIGYINIHEMLDKEKPSILHIVTSPLIPRATWIPTVKRYDCIKVLVMEKPIALTPEQYDDFERNAQDISFKIVINHQRRYFLAFRTLGYLIENNLLGNIKSVNIACYGEPMEMGTHAFDIALMVNPNNPTGLMSTVWGNVLKYDPYYLCPDNIQTTLFYDNGMITNIFIGTDKVLNNETDGIRKERFTDNIYHYSNRASVVVSGTLGNYYWNEYGYWGYNVGNHHIKYQSDYFVDTPYAQTLLSVDNIRACNEDFDMPCSVNNALMGIRLLFASYKSAYKNKCLRNIDIISQDDYKKLLNNLRS